MQRREILERGIQWIPVLALFQQHLLAEQAPPCQICGSTQDCQHGSPDESQQEG